MVTSVMMTRLFGRLDEGVTAGIKCRPYMDTAVKSLVNSKASEFLVGKLKMNNTAGPKKEIEFPLFFTMIKNTQKKTAPGKKIIYGPVFTGEVEKKYLKYLDKLDWDSLDMHIMDFPRRRSEDEMRLIFEKCRAHYGKKYPSAELKEIAFASFKKSLALIDENNSNNGYRICVISDHVKSYPGRLYIDRSDDDVSEGNCQRRRIYFPSFFTKMKAVLKKTDNHKKRIYGPVFTGEAEKRYLEYLKKLDWDSLHKHVTDFPRRRSEDEERVIFDKWAAHYGKKYKCHVFRTFKLSLERIDNENSKQKWFTLGLDSDADVDPDVDNYELIYGSQEEMLSYVYRVNGFPIECVSSTPTLYCELTATTVDSLYYNKGVEVCFPT